MPTYEYRCSECGYEFESFQGIKDVPLTECPECKGRLKRLIGAGSGFIFKGNGFYTTDYKSKSYKESKKKEEESRKKKNDKCPVKEKCPNSNCAQKE